MRKRWLVGLLLAVVAVSVIGGVVAADTGDTPPSGAGISNTALIDKVAEILGMDPATLNDAYQQAIQEIRSEQQQEWLDALVENGSLTEEQAAVVAAWFDSKPDVLGSALFGLRRGPRSLYWLPPLRGVNTSTVYDRLATILELDAGTVEQAFRDASTQLSAAESGERFSEMLENLVEQGVLTDEEAGDLGLWFDQRPEAADKLPGGCFGMRGRGMFGGRGHFGRDGMLHGASGPSQNGFKFKFHFADDATEIVPGSGFGWFGFGRGFGFQLPSPAGQDPTPTPAPADTTTGESA